MRYNKVYKKFIYIYTLLSHIIYVINIFKDTSNRKRKKLFFIYIEDIPNKL